MMTTTQPQAIPMWLPHIGPEVIKAASDALEIGYLGLGSATKEFEDALADYLELDAGRALMSTNSCTAALNCACLLAGAGPGTEVIAPSFTYVAAHQAITATGAEVVFCDIEEPTLTVNPDALAELVTERTRAIMVCHFAGLVGRLDEIYQVAAAHGLEVVPGRMVWELRPQVRSDKGDAVRRVAAESGARRLVVAGDDLGDLPAFAVAAEAGGGLRVAVRSEEAPAELLDAADLVVDGPEGVRELLEHLLR